MADDFTPGQREALAEAVKLNDATYSYRSATREHATISEPLTAKDYWRFIFTTIATLVLIRWFIITSACIMSYHGGRVLQCTYEPLYLEGRP